MNISDIQVGKVYYVSISPGWSFKALILSKNEKEVKYLIPVEKNEQGYRKSCDMGMRSSLNDYECYLHVKHEIEGVNVDGENIISC